MFIPPKLLQATMEEPTPSTSSQTDIFNSLSPSSKLEEKWPSLSSTASSIQPAQKALSMPASWMTQTIKKIPLQDHVKNREKYAQYFQGNKILPIHELVQEVQPKIVSFVVSDLKTRRLAGLRKETFEVILKTAGIPTKYYCKRSFSKKEIPIKTQINEATTVTPEKKLQIN